jgi:response regulator of citrate/malate metabolism
MKRDRNESGQFADGIDPETVLDVVDAREDLGRPVTAGDVVDELGIARRTAHNKLGALVERGVLETRKIGARGRVWWRPIPADSVDTQPPRDARWSISGMDLSEDDE